MGCLTPWQNDVCEVVKPLSQAAQNDKMKDYVLSQKILTKKIVATAHTKEVQGAGMRFSSMSLYC